MIQELMRSMPELEFAIRVVRESVPLAKQVQRELSASRISKSDRSPVTVADFSIQALIACRLAQAFSRDVLVAEESSHLLGESSQRKVLEKVVGYVRKFLPEASTKKVCDWIDHGTSEAAERFWTLDPIDGTEGFLRGAQYVVALALIEKGEVLLSVLGCPHLCADGHPDQHTQGSTAVAVKGKGSWAASVESPEKWNRLQVSKRVDPKEAIMLGSVDAGHTDRERLKRLISRLGIQASPMLMDSQAKYAALAGGAGDLFLYFTPPHKPDYRMKIWDVAPGYLIAREAGGQASDIEGKKLDFSCGKTLDRNTGLAVTNGALHSALLRALREC